MKNTNEYMNKIVACILLINCGDAHRLVDVCKIWVVEGIVPVIEGLNSKFAAFNDPITGSEHRIYKTMSI